jgi:hypothetical protein
MKINHIIKLQMKDKKPLIQLKSLIKPYKYVYQTIYKCANYLFIFSLVQHLINK